MMYQANENRYKNMSYRQVGKSGLKLPAISLGLWHNFGDVYSLENQRAILRTAFDNGITHFDLAKLIVTSLLFRLRQVIICGQVLMVSGVLKRVLSLAVIKVYSGWD